MIIKIKNIIFRVLYILILIYLCVFVPTLWGSKPLVVISGSMEPTLKVGGLLYYHEIKLEEFNKDDILVYQTKDDIVSHRLVEITNSGFITKGDANNTIDNLEIMDEQVLGKGTNWSIPYLGYYADFIYSHKYILFISVSLIIIDLLNDKYKEHKMKVSVKNEKNN